MYGTETTLSALQPRQPMSNFIFLRSSLALEVATSGNPQMSFDSAIELLTSTMRDPMNAKVCAVILGIAADRIEQELEACTTISAKIKLAKSQPNFLRAGINFLTFNQLPSDFAAMVNHLILCRCDLGRTEIMNRHKPCRPRVDGQVEVGGVDLLFDAVSTVSNCLILALSDLSQHKFYNEKSKYDWPRGPEDLLPYGPKDSVVRLEHWVAGLPRGYVIFKLAGKLASFYVPFAREVQSIPFYFALSRPTKHLEMAVEFYDKGDSLLLARTHYFTYPVKTILEFFSDLMQCDISRFNLMVIARGSWISPVLARLTTILSDLPMEWSESRTLVQFLTIYANANVDPASGLATMRFERELLTELPYRDALEDAFTTIMGVRKLGCQNIACPSASEVIHSRLCSGCDLIRFCSESCQKEAWRSSIVPHKRLCAHIRIFKESLGAADWSLMWTPDFTYAQFKDMCTTKNVDTELVKKIGSTILAIRMRQGMFREDLERAGASQIDRLTKAAADKLSLKQLEDFKKEVGPESVTVIQRKNATSVFYSSAIE